MAEISSAAKIAIALDSDLLQDINDTFNDIVDLYKPDKIRKTSTPDNTYCIYYWTYPAWDSYTLDALMRSIQEIRHAMVIIDENGLIHSEVKSFDKYGCDEEFSEILQTESCISVWDVEPLSLEPMYSPRLGNMIALFSDNADVKVFDAKDYGNFFAKPIAIYDGRNSIPEELNECEVYMVDHAIDGIEVYIVREEEELAS